MMKESRLFFEEEFQKIVVHGLRFEETLLVGRICYARLHGNLRLKMEFIAQEAPGKYAALKITLLHLHKGLIDSIILNFVDVIGSKQVEGSGFKDGLQPYIWEYENTREWFFYQPSEEDYQCFARVINDYIHMFVEKRE